MRSLAALRRALAPAFLIAIFLSTGLFTGCGLLPDQADETVGWTANKLYAEAKDAMAEGAYEKAIKYYEKLEARFPYGRYAQQAQLEVAYAYFRQKEVVPTIAAAGIPSAKVGIGAVGKTLSLLKANKCEELVLAGKFQRPSLA